MDGVAPLSFYFFLFFIGQRIYLGGGISIDNINRCVLRAVDA